MFFTKSIILALAACAVAHPGHEAKEALAGREVYHNNKRALDACATKLEALQTRGVERRKAEMERQRAARGIPINSPYQVGNIAKRGTIDVLLKDHEGTINATEALAADTPADYVFNATSSTVLNPEGEVGPFYVLGEYVTSDVRGTEPGIDVVLQAQIVDVNTCEAVPNVYLDIWSANSTGVYGGVHSQNNGNYADTSNLNKTALRGLQLTDEDGVAQFTTKFPGHYAGRCTHLHVIIHEDATELANGTIAGGTSSHIGQLFWDQSLVTEVEATSPYSTNTQPVTKNGGDHVFVGQETRGSDSDPVFNYVFIGDDVASGLFSWIYIGIDQSASYTPTYSFELTDHGGEPVNGRG